MSRFAGRSGLRCARPSFSCWAFGRGRVRRPARLLDAGRGVQRAAARPGRRLPDGRNSSDQIPLYDGLTPKLDNVTAADLPNFFKKNVFGLGGLPCSARRRSRPARA